MLGTIGISSKFEAVKANIVNTLEKNKTIDNARFLIRLPQVYIILILFLLFYLLHSILLMH